MPPHFLWTRGKFLSAEAIPLVALCWVCSLGSYLSLWCGLFTIKIGRCSILFSLWLLNFIVFNSLVSCTLFHEILCSCPTCLFFFFPIPPLEISLYLLNIFVSLMSKLLRGHKTAWLCDRCSQRQSVCSSPGTWQGGGQIGDESKRLSNKWQKCVSSGLSMCRGKGTIKDGLVFNGRRKRLGNRDWF